MRFLRSIPSQHMAILDTHITRCKKRLSPNHGRQDGPLSLVADGCLKTIRQQGFHPIPVILIIHHGTTVNTTRTDSSFFRFYYKEIFQRAVCIEFGRQIRQVITEIHRLTMQFSICPFSEHRSLRIHTQSGLTVPASVPGKFEVFHFDRTFGFSGSRIRCNAHRQFQLASSRIIHQQTKRTHRPVFFPHMIKFRVPSPSFLLPYRKTVFIRTIDKAFVSPSVSPGIDDDPGATLILIPLTVDLITVQIEDNPVVIADNGQGMVHPIPPAGHVFLSDHPGCPVSSLRIISYWPLLAGTGHTDTADTAYTKRIVTLMIPQPVFYILTPLFRINAIRRKRIVRNAVEHRRIPFVIALHPTEIRVRTILITEQTGISGSTVNGRIGHTIGPGHTFLSGIAVGQQPGEVGGIDMFRTVGRIPPISVHLMRKHVADARSGTT